MLADFTITVHDARKPLTVQVKVHDSVAALRSAASRFTNGQPGRKKNALREDLSDVLGICHRFHWDKDPLCAIVRLAPPHIGAGIVAHELAHAAVWLWEIQNKFEVPLLCQDDEWFCWTLGELVRQTTIQLFERNVY